MLLHVDDLLRLERHLLWAEGLSVGAVRAHHAGLLEAHHHLGVECELLRHATEHLLHRLLHRLLHWLLHRLFYALLLHWLLNDLHRLWLVLDLSNYFSNFRLAMLHLGLGGSLLGLFWGLGGGLGSLLVSFRVLLGSCLVDHLLAAALATSSTSLSAFAISAASSKLTTLGTSSTAAALLTLSDLTRLGLLISLLLVHLSGNLSQLFFTCNLSFDFIFGDFKDFVLGLFDEPLLVVAALSLLSAFLGADFGFLFSGGAALGGFDPALTPFLLLLSLVLAVLALPLDFPLTVLLGLLFLLAALSLMPVELLKVLVLFGGVESFQVGVDLLGDELLLEADVHDLVVVEDLRVARARYLLIVLHDVPLFFVKFDQLFI